MDKVVYRSLLRSLLALFVAALVMGLIGTMQELNSIGDSSPMVVQMRFEPVPVTDQ